MADVVFFLPMDIPNIDQYVVGIYADYKGVGITLIGTNKEIDTYWVFDHIYHDRATIKGIKDSLDDLLVRFPEIRQIHVNNMGDLRQELSRSYQKKLFTKGTSKSETGIIRSEKRSDVIAIEFEVENLAFILNSYINDGKLIFRESLLAKKDNLKSEIEKYNLNDVNQRVFSLYVAISHIEPIKTKILCASIPQVETTLFRY